MIEIVYPMRRKAAPGPSDGLLHCEHLDAPMVLANLAALPRTGYSGTTPPRVPLQRVREPPPHVQPPAVGIGPSRSCHGCADAAPAARSAH